MKRLERHIVGVAVPFLCGVGRGVRGDDGVSNRLPVVRLHLLERLAVRLGARLDRLLVLAVLTDWDPDWLDFAKN